MKEINLTKNKKALVDQDSFNEINDYKWFAITCSNKIYAARWTKQVNKKRHLILMHRFLLGINEKNIYVDHIDGNTLNNCKSNLRISSHQENLQNRIIHKNNKSGYPGVCWVKNMNKYLAQITHNKIHYNLGYYTSAEEASKVYEAKAKQLRGNFHSSMDRRK